MDYQLLAGKYLQAMYALNGHKAQQAINSFLCGESAILQHIASHKDTITPKEISEAILISGARAATTLNSLENKGYIIRRIDISDRRRILINLTSEGIAKAENNMREVLELTEQMLRLLDERDAEKYIRITGILAEAGPCVCRN